MQLARVFCFSRIHREFKALTSIGAGIQPMMAIRNGKVPHVKGDGGTKLSFCTGPE